MGHLIAAIPGSFVIDYAQINDPEALDALFAFVGSTARAGESAHRLPQAVRRQPRGRLRELGRAAGLPGGPRRSCSPPRRRAIRAAGLSRVSAPDHRGDPVVEQRVARELGEAPVGRVRPRRRLEEQRLAPEEAPRRRPVRASKRASTAVALLGRVDGRDPRHRRPVGEAGAQRVQHPHALAALHLVEPEVAGDLEHVHRQAVVGPLAVERRARRGSIPSRREEVGGGVLDLAASRAPRPRPAPARAPRSSARAAARSRASGSPRAWRGRPADRSATSRGRTATSRAGCTRTSASGPGGAGRGPPGSRPAPPPPRASRGPGGSRSPRRSGSPCRRPGARAASTSAEHRRPPRSGRGAAPRPAAGGSASSPG